MECSREGTWQKGQREPTPRPTAANRHGRPPPPGRRRRNGATPRLPPGGCGTRGGRFRKRVDGRAHTPTHATHAAWKPQHGTRAELAENVTGRMNRRADAGSSSSSSSRQFTRQGRPGAGPSARSHPALPPPLQPECRPMAGSSIRRHARLPAECSAVRILESPPRCNRQPVLLKY